MVDHLLLVADATWLLVHYQGKLDVVDIAAYAMQRMDDKRMKVLLMKSNA